MKVEKNDIVHSENFLKLIKKLKCELEGEEILAAAECIKWFYRHSQEMKAEFNKPPMVISAPVLEQPSPTVENSPPENPPAPEKKQKKK